VLVKIQLYEQNLTLDYFEVCLHFYFFLSCESSPPNYECRLNKTKFLKKLMSSFAKNIGILHPYFITGFTDAEGSFIVRIRDNPKLKIG
jgi:hypothetical protein